MQAQANFANEASIDGEMQAPLTFEFLDSEAAQIPSMGRVFYACNES